MCNYGSSPSAARNLHILLDKLRQTRIPLKKSQKTVGCLLCPYCFFTICIICITLEYNTIVITAIIICIEPEKKIFCKIMYNKIDADILQEYSFSDSIFHINPLGTFSISKGIISISSLLLMRIGGFSMPLFPVFVISKRTKHGFGKTAPLYIILISFNGTPPFLDWNL